MPRGPLLDLRPLSLIRDLKRVRPDDCLKAGGVTTTQLVTELDDFLGLTNLLMGMSPANRYLKEENWDLEGATEQLQNKYGPCMA